MNTITLTASDISCEHCKATIEREVGALSGVQSVAVDVPERRITVAFDPEQVTQADIVEVLDEEGYPVTP